MQSGIYSVKSSYYFLKFEARSTTTQAQALPDHPKPPWNQIWKLNLPNKLKNFLWRAAGNALPISAELVQRCIINDPICSLCSSHVRMFYTLCGLVQLCHKCGKKIHNGALDKLQGITISLNFSLRYWTWHAMWNYSLQSHGQSGSEETNLDFHLRGSLWTRLCRL